MGNQPKLVSFGVDEDKRPLLDSQEVMIRNYKEWFMEEKDQLEVDQLIQIIVEDTEYRFNLETEKTLDDLIKGMKEECDYPNWDDGSIDGDFDVLVKQFKDVVGDRKYKIYSWALEYDSNILVLFED